MSKSFISKEALEKSLKELVKAKEYTLFAPVRNGKTLDFAKISDGMDFVISDEIAYKSPKEVLFPQVETLMIFAGGEVSESPLEGKTVVFGAKPCDAEALRVLHEILMAGKFHDPFFKRRFDNNIIIAIGCVKEKPGCFCAQRGTNKEFSDFSDIMLIPEDDESGFNVAFLSDKGKELWRNMYGTDDIDIDIYDDKNRKTVEKLELSKDLDDAELFDIIDWGKATEICQGCGLCTFICPSCHCFDIKDVSEKDETKRYRCWDSCMYPNFTLHASGHNPRETVRERFRQRVLHKYLYINKNFGYTACTGCGRCIRSCPTGMNIKKIVENIMEVLP